MFVRAELTNAHHDWFNGDCTGLCCYYWNKKLKATIIESSEAEHNAVNCWEGFVLPS